jgi:membrane-bound ClpP family serine protease
MNKEREDEFAFGKENYKWLLIGIVVLVIGNLLLVGGGSDDPNVFNPEIFSFRRLTLAPMVILAGFATVLIAIVKKSK